MQGRGALPEEEGNVIREYKATHEEQILCSWLRKDGEDTKGIIIEAGRETKEEMCKKRTREEEKEENDTGVSAKRRCVNPVSAEAFDIFSQGEDLESCGGVSWVGFLENPDDVSDWEPETGTVVSALPFAIDVHVSPSSVVTECYEDVSVDSDGEFVELQFFSLQKKSVRVCWKRIKEGWVMKGRQ